MNGPMSAALRRLAAGLAVALALTTAHAGRPCDERPPTVPAVTQGLGLGERTARALDASGAEVVLLARAGQDLSEYRLRWSHLALAYRVTPPEGDTPGTWRVVHKLNHCGSDRAGLYRQGLGDFFLDSPHRYEAAFAVLRPEVAQRLRPLLDDNAGLARWHEPRYSVVSYAWGTRYQQSNQWLIETLAGAMDPSASNRERAQAWLRLQGYEPTRLRIGAFTRLGGRMTQANVAFDDHPSHLRFSDRIDTVTADSVFAWVSRAGLSEAERRVR
jgi:hypothetical protein